MNVEIDVSSFMFQEERNLVANSGPLILSQFGTKQKTENPSVPALPSVESKEIL